ncbi:MAG: hypothetical protein PHI66_02360 [Candidatus Pacebacteria bacterium]|nr:hypothetical protein [Candidatus Paceibacterota bacterium]
MKKIKEKEIDIREIVYCQDDEKSFGDIFVYEPENIDEQKLGSLFIIGELRDLSRNSSYIVNLLVSKIKKEFYLDTSRSPEEGLEAGLLRANEVLSDLAKQGHGEYLGKLNMVCGTYESGRFYLSQVGRVRSLLIRDGSLSEIIKEDDSKTVSSTKAFDNIASGDLVDGDMIVFGTPGLSNLFSMEELRKMSVRLSLDEFALKLQESAEEEDEMVSALVIKMGSDKAAEKIGYTELDLDKDSTVATEEHSSEVDEQAVTTTSETEEASEEEIYVDSGSEEDPRRQVSGEETEGVSAYGDVQEEDFSQEEKDAILSENIKKVSLSDIIKEYEKMDNSSKSGEDRDSGIERIISKKEENSFEDLDESGIRTSDKIKAGVRKVVNKKNLHGAVSVLGSAGKKVFTAKKEYKVDREGKRFKLPSAKTAVYAVLAAAILFSLSHIVSNDKNPEQGENNIAYYQGLIDNSRSKMEQAEIELISDSSGAAGKLLVEARNLAMEVRGGSDALDVEAEEIINKAQEEIDRIDLIERIVDPEILTTFNGADITDIVDFDGTFYVINEKEKAVYEVDSENGGLEKVTDFSGKIEKISFARNFQNQEILISDGSKFLSFNPGNGSIETVESNIAIGGVKDFTTYSRFIYILSPSENQIYKYQKASAGFSGKTDWLNGGDVSGAVSFAVDQYIYTLNSDGTVGKYFTGEEYVNANGDKFAIDQPIDPISNPTLLYTETDQKYIYIVDGDRILLFDKGSGDLVRQYVGDAFKNISDISVDAKESTLLVVAEGMIAKIDMTVE